MMIRQMYLVQRGRFKNLDVFKTSAAKDIANLIDFDYMGAAEFEWGALPASLKSMSSGNIEIAKTNWTNEAGLPLWIMSSETTSFAEAHEMIEDYLISANPHVVRGYTTKEAIHLEDYIIPWYRKNCKRYAFFQDYKTDKFTGPKFNFWIDIEHDFAFFFGAQDRVNALKEAMEATKKKLELRDDLDRCHR